MWIMDLMHNKSVQTNRRPASPFGAGRQFESASCSPPTGASRYGSRPAGFVTVHFAFERFRTAPVAEL